MWILWSLGKTKYSYINQFRMCVSVNNKAYFVDINMSGTRMTYRFIIFNDYSEIKIISSY